MTRVALVTGAGTGIGRGIALALARRGMRVALTGRRREPLEAVSEEIRRLPASPPAAIFPADLADARERRRLIEQVHRELGALDILVNNAGVMLAGSLSGLSGEDVERAVAVNLTAPIDLTRLAQADLAERRGSVVFVASNVHDMPLPFTSLYTATKSALANLVTSLRYELEPLGIHLLLAYPPDSETAMLAGRQGANRARITLADPEQVGEIMVRALEGGRRQVHWGLRERLLISFYQALPRAAQALLRWQRRRFLPPAESKPEEHHVGTQ
jgi:short-subunit dehydrogenase